MSKYLSRALISILCSTLLYGCSTVKSSRDGPPLHDVDVTKIKSPTPHPLKKSRSGNDPTYLIHGKRYHVLDSASGYMKRGVASWYGRKFHGQPTSSGEPYNMFAMTAASRSLPIPVYARVTNLENGRSIVVKINDRGPFADNRIIDLSYVAAKKLGFANKGTAKVEVKAITFDHPQHLHLANKHSYYLQVGVFKTYRNALALRSRLQKLTDQPVLIHKSSFQHHTLYHVGIGPFVGFAQSDKLQHLLKDLGLGKGVSINY